MIAEIEDDLLAQAESVFGNTIRVYGSLPGGWTQPILERSLQTSPGIYIAFQGTVRKEPGVHDGRFTIYSVAKGAEDVQRRRGTQRTIGAYEIVERLVPKLDQFILPNVTDQRVDVTGVDNLFRDAMFDLGGTVYGIQLNLPNLDLQYMRDTSTLKDFMTFDVTYNLDTTQNDDPVAEDTVTGLDKL